MRAHFLFSNTHKTPTMITTKIAHVTAPFPLTDDNSRLLGVGDRLVGDIYWQAALTTRDDIWLKLDEADEIYGKEVTDDMSSFFRVMFESSVEGIAAEYGIDTEMGKRALQVMLENLQLLDSKQKDYGAANIAAFGEYGVLVRLNDKVARLRNLLNNSRDPANESIEDSWRDICNYAAIAILCRRGEWQ